MTWPVPPGQYAESARRLQTTEGALRIGMHRPLQRFGERLRADVAQTVADPTSTVPTLGASGAIAAVMGAFLITYPRDRIRTLLFIFYFVTVTVVPAAVLVGLWFLTQVFSELGTLGHRQTGGVAFMAHVSGFLFGALTARFFELRERRRAQGLEG